MDGSAFLPRLPTGIGVDRRGALTLLLHPTAPRWVVVNATGLQVAMLCDGQHTIPQIAATIAARYGLAPDAVLPDVRACLDDLGRAGFLEDLPSSPPLSLEGRGKPKGGGWRLHLYLTEQCNLRCRHCGVADGPSPPDLLSSQAVRRLIDQAVEAGAEGIAFSGGEPLLRADCLDLLAYSARRVKTLLSTNATLIDEPTAAALAELGVIVQISLDGATAAVHDAVRGTGAFERAWRGIELLQRCGLGERLSLNVTLLRHNVGQVGEMVALAAERGVLGVRFFPVQRLGRAAERWADLAPSPEEYAAAYHLLYQELKTERVAVSKGLSGLELEPPEEGMWCRLGRLLLVDAQGGIYPCALLTAPEFCLGHIADTPPAEALASAKLHNLMALCERRRNEIKECQACIWRHFCQAGCPAGVWLLHGTWYATDGLCDLRRELYRALIFERAEKRLPGGQMESACGVP